MLVCRVTLVRKATPEEHQDGYAAQRVAVALGGTAVGIICDVVMVLPESVVKHIGSKTLEGVCKRMRSDKAVTVLHIGEIATVGKLEHCEWAQV